MNDDLINKAYSLVELIDEGKSVPVKKEPLPKGISEDDIYQMDKDTPMVEHLMDGYQNAVSVKYLKSGMEYALSKINYRKLVDLCEEIIELVSCQWCNFG